MTAWTGQRVARVLGCEAGAHDLVFRSVSTDTRAIESGDLFVALTGDRFDGHDFLADAVQRGATGVVVRRGAAAPEGVATFSVPDTLAALGALAHERRQEIAGPVVAVTGTNGKTATKEMLAHALGTRWQVHATRGNLNNLIGVPLTLLSAPSETGALVVEAGASVPGEIARLQEIIAPTIAVITNVSAGHLEGFGSEEGVLAEKLALLAGVATAVVGTRPPSLAGRARGMASRVLVGGTAPHADIRPDAWSLDENGCAEIVFGGVAMRLPLVGRHQVENAMLAFAVARALELDSAVVARALEAVALPAGRCEVLRDGGLTILHDAYNANPLSIAASLETARAMRGGRPLVVVLGTMLELGELSAELHRSVADQVLAAEPDLIAVTGAFATAFERHAAALGDRLLLADDPPTLGKRLRKRLAGNELVLLKASRGMRLERVIPHLMADGDA